MYKGIRKDLRNPEFNRVLALRTVGNFLVLFAVYLVLKTFYQPVKEEARFFVEKITGKKYVVAEKPSEKGRLSDFLKGQNIEVIVPKDPNFSIVIPKIAANANVIADVDPSSEKTYLAALKKGVAHSLGTAYPGEGGHIFMFAHSTDYFWNVGNYNAVFYLLYKLQKGDEVDLFYKGTRFVYKVEDTKIVDPGEVEYLTRKTDHELLTLQTCWPPGTTLKRQLVFAKRVVE